MTEYVCGSCHLIRFLCDCLSIYHRNAQCSIPNYVLGGDTKEKKTEKKRRERASCMDIKKGCGYGAGQGR